MQLLHCIAVIARVSNGWECFDEARNKLVIPAAAGGSASALVLNAMQLNKSLSKRVLALLIICCETLTSISTPQAYIIATGG